MALTGWTYDELRAQPAPVVRGLMHRVFARLVWDRDLVATARRGAGDRSSYANLAAWAEARRAQLAAAKAVEEIEAALWPEDDDG